VFCLAMVLLLTFEVFMRYVLNAPTKYSYEVATMIGVTVGAGGLAYTHLHHGHVRVDVIWRLLSTRGEWAQFSFVQGEIMTKTTLYPPAWPVRAVMVLGFLMFIPQGVAKLIRDIYLVKGVELKGIDKL